MRNNGMESMKRLLSVGAALLALTGFGARERGYADVRLRGWLGERLERLIENHVAKTDVDYLTAPFAVMLKNVSMTEAVLLNVLLKL